jgi:hypothetical protein
VRLDDPAVLAAEYADDARLHRRAAAFTGPNGAVDARAVVAAAVAQVAPLRVLEVGRGWAP